ncbi:MAG: serine/threonine protein kinase [Pseudohongiellaceae bacterium]|jgi:serine/threonine protein kinase
MCQMGPKKKKSGGQQDVPAGGDGEIDSTLPSAAPNPGDMYTLPMAPPPGEQPPTGHPISTLPPTGGALGEQAKDLATLPPAQDSTHTPTSQLGNTTPPSTHPYHQPSAQAAPPLPIDSVFAKRFEILGLLGEGGMGQVFRVRDRQLDNSEAALKILHPKFSANPRFRDLFYKEINNAKQFVSEYVTQVRDTGQDEGRLFLTMDLVAGEPLRELVDREQNLDPRHALEIARQTLLGLTSGHDKGLIHRDIKPSNIMLVRGIPKTGDNPFGVGVRLLDFGIAAVADELGEGQIAGTPMYMSPEQASGQKLDARSDLFSLGNVLFEMISGSRLFHGKTIQDVTTAVLNVQVGPRIEELEHLSPAIRKLLSKALEKDRSKRFQSAEEFIAAIEKSSAYRLPKGVPFWMGGLLAASTIAAAGLGYLYVDAGNQLNDLNQESISLVEHRAALRGKETMIANLQQEGRQQASNTSAKDDVDVLNQTLMIDLDNKTDLLTAKQSDFEAERQKALQLNAQNAELSSSLTEANQRANEAENQLIQLIQLNSPARLKGTNFDKILSRVSNSNGVGAREILNAAQDDGLLTDQDHDGGAFLRDLVEAAAALQEHHGAPSDQVSLGMAQDSFAEVEAGLEQFASDAQDWLTVPTQVGDADPQRHSQLIVTVTSMGGTLSALSTSFLEELNAADELAESYTYSSDFDDVMASANDTGISGLSKFFESYNVGVHAAVVAQDGTLNRSKLLSLPHLAHWGQLLEGQTLLLDTPATREVIRLWEAQRWYGGEGLAFDHSIDTPDIPVNTPSNNWKLQLALQMAMTKLASSAIPQSSVTNYYRDELLETDGEVRWVVDSLVADGSRAVVTSKQYDASGKNRTDFADRTATFLDLIFSVGSVSLELTQLDENISIALWAPQASSSAPSGPAWSKNLDTARFASDRIATPVPCLVIHDDKGQFWYSPEFGLVHELRSGFISRDLVETK